jgi:pilus assembly protein CpaC
VVRTQDTAYLFARAPGQSNAYFFDADGRQILALDIEVTQDMAALHQLIQRAIPGTQITADTIGQSVVLGGVAKNAAEAKTAFDLAAMFAGDEARVMSTVAITGRDQVMLRVRIAEVQRDVVKALGIDIQQLAVKGTEFLVLGGTVNPLPSQPAHFLNQPGGFVRGMFGNKDVEFDGILQAMERDGLLKTLAEPTLTAISGESAKFLAGGEFPIRVSSVNQGEREVSIEFKPFGVGLGFTPVVLSEGRISLRISTEVSELSSEGALENIPGLKVRRAETTVELPSGGSMVMAGLIQDRTKQDIHGVPGLKDLPVLGALFRSREFQSNQTELVVIVTPFIVDAVNEKHLATPLDGLNIAHDRQTFLFGRLHKVYGVAGQAPKGGYQGSVGFIVE